MRDCNVPSGPRIIAVSTERTPGGYTPAFGETGPGNASAGVASLQVDYSNDDGTAPTDLDFAYVLR